MPILLHDRYPNRLKISRATISHRVDAVTKRSLASVGVSSDHIRINAVALKITCKKWMFVDLLKTKSFLQFQTAHNKAQTPTRMCLAVLESTPSSHVPNNMLMEVGGLILKAIWTDRHRILASGQSRKRCLIVSLWSQKLHLAEHIQLRFVRLSFVKMTYLCTNHINTLIRKGTFTFQTCFEEGMTLEFMTSRYIDLAENTLSLVSFQYNRFGRWDNWTSINRLTRWSQASQRLPTSVLRKLILRGVDCKTFAT